MTTAQRLTPLFKACYALDVPSVRALLKEAPAGLLTDFIICASGASLYEAAYLGLADSGCGPSNRPMPNASKRYSDVVKALQAAQAPEHIESGGRCRYKPS